jgi:uncharacterized protein
MVMHVIIDGYNLLAVVRPLGRADLYSEMGRETLLRLLSGYRHRKGHALTVVFDGWQRGQPIENSEHRAGVHVIYSKRGERADQVIQRLAREYGVECAVVSSDHEIVNSAQAHGALAISARAFADKLHTQGSSETSVPYKELDTGDDQAEGRRPEKKGNPRKLPKRLRRRSRQLKGF